MNFNYKTQPFDHQRVALEDSWSEKYYALLMEMGTGKTKVALDTMSILYEQNKITACVVIAPKGVYDNWTRSEIPAHVPDRIERIILRWTPNSSKKYQDEVKAFFEDDSGALKIFVVNTEAFSTARATRMVYDFCKKHLNNLVIVDESTTIKNRKALRSKNIIELHKLSKYRRILTGSPITKSPMDLFSQCLFLDKNALGFNSYYGFQNRYSIVVKRTMGAKSFQEITGYRRLDELTDKLESFSNRVLKKDCLDLPDKLYIRRDVPITDEQAKVYNQMKKLALAKLESGELVTTASVLTQIMRLQQICCGFLQPDDGEIQALPNLRLEALMEIAEDVQGKAIIWATYTHDINRISTALRERFGYNAVATYYGATEQEERQNIVNEFQDPDSELRFFVGQPKTGGYGITLTAANTVIYFSNSYDLEIRLQSEDRAHRIGQKKPVTYIDLVTPYTIDEKILDALKSKINIAGRVLKEDTKGWLM